MYICATMCPNVGQNMAQTCDRVWGCITAAVLSIPSYWGEGSFPPYPPQMQVSCQKEQMLLTVNGQNPQELQTGYFVSF